MKNYNQALYHEIFISEEYALLKPLLPTSKIIFDIWGHIWYFSQRCLKHNPNLTIHFFEPFEQLINQAKNNLPKQNIYFNTCAVSNNNWTGTFLYNPQKTMQSSSTPSFLNPDGIPQNIKTLNINDYLETHQLSQIDIMKIDTEGMEYEIIRSIAHHHRKKIKNLILEIHLLQDSDFKAFHELQNTLKQHFSSIQISDSPYTPKIKLCFAQK